MDQRLPDGSLLSWEQIEYEHPWSALLLGNGLSINVWDRFHYDSLYREARRLRTTGLSASDRELFDALDTQNFERVLGDLDRTIRVLGALGRDTAFLLKRYQRVQRALGQAIRAVHVPWQEVPAETLGRIKRELCRYERVFTTSYDLLLYWASGHDGWDRLVDCFWGPRCRFDPNNADVRADSVPLYFLHGAMHLVVEGKGHTRKLTSSSLNLLEQFGQPIAGDPRARPLLVTEGSWRDKLIAIEANPYLAHAYDTLNGPYLEVPLVVFGSSLGPQDEHLVEAIGKHERPIAVSMTRASRAELRARQSLIYGRIRAAPLLFFDAATHPLGASDLTISVPDAPSVA